MPDSRLLSIDDDKSGVTVRDAVIKRVAQSLQDVVGQIVRAAEVGSAEQIGSLPLSLWKISFEIRNIQIVIRIPTYQISVCFMVAANGKETDSEIIKSLFSN